MTWQLVRNVVALLDFHLHVHLIMPVRSLPGVAQHVCHIAGLLGVDASSIRRHHLPISSKALLVAREVGGQSSSEAKSKLFKD